MSTTRLVTVYFHRRQKGEKHVAKDRWPTVCTRNGFRLNSGDKFAQLELYKSLLANAGRFVYYEQTDDEGSDQSRKRQY